MSDRTRSDGDDAQSPGPPQPTPSQPPLSDDAVDQLLRSAGASGRRSIPASDPPPFVRNQPARLPLVAAAAVVMIAGAWAFRDGLDRGQSVDQTIPVADGTTTSSVDEPNPASTAPDSTSGQSTTTRPPLEPPPFVDLDFSRLVSGNEPQESIDVARPATGQTVTDPAFAGIEITRVTGDQREETTFAADIGAGSAFNADESLALLRQVSASGTTTEAFILVDVANAEVIDPPVDLPVGLTWNLTWSPVDPDVILYTEANALRQLNVSTRESSTIRVFDDCREVRSDSGSISWDGDVVLLLCGSDQGDELYAYRISTDALVTRPVEADLIFLRVAPSGNRFVVSDADELEVLDSSLQPTGIRSDRVTRSTLTQTVDGQDVLIQADYGSSLAGNLVSLDLETGAARAVAGPSAGGFEYVSGLTTATAPVVGGSGRVVVTGGRRTGDALHGEIYVVDFSSATPEIGRVGYHRLSSPRGDDVDDLVAALSPSGTKILFHSDWGEGGQIDAYIIDLG